MNFLDFLKQNWIPLILILIITVVIIYLKFFKLSQSDDESNLENKIKKLESSTSYLTDTLSDIKNKITHGIILPENKGELVIIDNNSIASSNAGTPVAPTISKFEELTDNDLDLDAKIEKDIEILKNPEYLGSVEQNEMTDVILNKLSDTISKNQTSTTNVISGLNECDIESNLFNLGVVKSSNKDNELQDLESIYDDRLSLKQNITDLDLSPDYNNDNLSEMEQEHFEETEVDGDRDSISTSTVDSANLRCFSLALYTFLGLALLLGYCASIYAICF